jgi:hypothetical protein
MELENDHNVYILGAGFSADAGLPLIRDFLVRMRDSHEWLMNNSRQAEAEAVQEVLRFRLNAASTAYWVNLDLENIEELFSLASALPGKLDAKIKLAIAATLNFARSAGPSRKSILTVNGSSALFQRPPNPQSHGKQPEWAKLLEYSPPQIAGQIGTFDVNTYSYHVARLLGLFLSGNIKGKNTFITLNYDTILEEALSDLKIPFWYGFKGERVKFEPNANGSDARAAVKVLKLHGSINWARGREDSTLLRIFRTYEDLLVTGHRPELLPPTWKKIIEDQLETVWETAVESLSTATRIIIIGFSMPPTDMHFKYLMAAGLQKNVSIRKILFANWGDPKEMEAKARKLLREAYVEGKIIDFLSVAFRDFTGDTTGYCHGIGRPKQNSAYYTLQPG